MEAMTRGGDTLEKKTMRRIASGLFCQSVLSTGIFVCSRAFHLCVYVFMCVGAGVGVCAHILILHTFMQLRELSNMTRISDMYLCERERERAHTRERETHTEKTKRELVYCVVCALV